ncbi:MAG: hypothetical protein FWD57_17260 [Polyangiaceae bacterium]|nr:hypothetical protein [Polyangiaceae bacterium]
MHRSVENAVSIFQHPDRDASLGSLAAFGGIGRHVGLFMRHEPPYQNAHAIHATIVGTESILRNAGCFARTQNTGDRTRNGNSHMGPRLTLAGSLSTVMSLVYWGFNDNMSRP